MVIETTTTTDVTLTSSMTAILNGEQTDCSLSLLPSLSLLDFDLLDSSKSCVYLYQEMCGKCAHTVKYVARVFCHGPGGILNLL